MNLIHIVYIWSSESTNTCSVGEWKDYKPWTCLLKDAILFVKKKTFFFFNKNK